VVAKRYRMTAAAVRAKFKLKRVQDALKERMEPVRLEQERQRMVAEAAAEVTAKLEAEKADLEARLKAATEMPAIDVLADTCGVVIGQELMRLVRLDPERHGRVKHEAIKTAYVVRGLMKQGNTERIIPPDPNDKGGVGGIYSSLFDRLRVESGSEAPPLPAPTAATPPEPPVLEGEVHAVFDLTPNPTPLPARTAAPPVMPPPGEALHAVPVKPKNNILTVEVG
jgi:hypothetical protein